MLTSWVLKEAVIKWRRRSLVSELSCWQLDPGSGRLCHCQDGVRPETVTGVAVGWRWGGMGVGLRNAGFEVVI